LCVGLESIEGGNGVRAFKKIKKRKANVEKRGRGEPSWSYRVGGKWERGKINGNNHKRCRNEGTEKIG